MAEEQAERDHWAYLASSQEGKDYAHDIVAGYAKNAETIDELIRKVIIPYTVPGLLDAMRVNIAATWNLVVVAELIAAQEGLGYRIVRAQRFLQTDTIFAVLIVIGVIGVAMDLLFRMLRNRLAPWARVR